MKRGLYKYHVDYGRMGSLSGCFVEDKALVDKLNQIDVTIEFGEVLGKHSDVRVHHNPLHITFITDDPNVIQVFDENDIEAGHNPFNEDLSGSCIAELDYTNTRDALSELINLDISKE